MKFKNDIKEFKTAERLPFDYIISVILNRILLNEDEAYILSSKYSPDNVIEILRKEKESNNNLEIDYENGLLETGDLSDVYLNHINE